ncbi:hypothetical protein DPMN_020627 [Dreissena polymorpha]|uniref:FLYWCH-type domain-containing protein n=1 Tax=Dreissena polymorpha TaxID=45954 RepID=A0A9D4MUP5_DREPO|nr:hypothetical protein DPMN_006045 [Dreissena polymorpha]KAH3896450.1 hypothetical protein DPMN_020627 [Dreissena polymorpha]
MSFDEPSVHPEDVGVLEAEVTFSLMESSSQRGKRKLVSSNGFTYVHKRFNPTKQTTIWRCSVRNKKSTCPAIVVQCGHSFVSNECDHSHQAKPGIDKGLVITTKVFLCSMTIKQLYTFHLTRHIVYFSVMFFNKHMYILTVYS